MGMMKKVATRIMLCPDKLNATEKYLIWRDRDLPRNLKKINILVEQIINDTKGSTYGNAGKWRSIFRIVHRKYFNYVEQIESYSLSFQALQRCTLLGREGNAKYVCQACINIHKKYLRKELNYRFRKRDWDYDLEDRLNYYDDPDFRIDIEAALGSVGVSDLDNQIGRLRFFEGRTYREIGEQLEIDASTAQRRFKRLATQIGSILDDYNLNERGCY